MAVLRMMYKATRFTNDAAGVEKSLRFLQSVVQVLAAWSISDADAAPYLIARKQFALGRRYLRFFKFIDCFVTAYTIITTQEGQDERGVRKLLMLGKWSFLGVYLLLESCTILDAMAITSTVWAPLIFHEAMKFWLYSLACSITLHIWSLVDLHAIISQQGRVVEISGFKYHAGDPSKSKEPRAESGKVRGKILTKLFTDLFDLSIPGSTTGWIKMSTGVVGGASAISTILASGEIWERVSSL